MLRLWLIVICSIFGGHAWAQHTTFDINRVTTPWSGVAPAADFALQDSGPSDTNGSHSTKISDNFVVNGQTFAYFLIKWNGVVQVASVRWSGTSWLWVYALFGSYTNYANNWPGYVAPTPTPTPDPTWSINGLATLSSDFNGSVVTLRCASTGEILSQQTIQNSQFSLSASVPVGCSEVEMYINDVLWHIFREGDTSSSAPMSWGDVEKTPFTLSVGPGINSGGLAGSTNAQGQWANAPVLDGQGNVTGYVGTNVSVSYNLLYVSGLTNGRIAPNRSVYVGTVPGGSSSAVSTNLALRPGGIYRVSINVPSYTWVSPGDGMDPLLVPTGTNTYTEVVNIPAGVGAQSIYVPGPNLPQVPTSTVTNPATPTNIVSTNPATSVGSTNVTISNPAGGTNVYEPGSVDFAQLSFTNEDLNEANIISRATNLLTSVQLGMSNFATGIDSLNEAAQSIATLSPPGASGSCTLTIGQFTIQLGGGPFGTARAVAGYLVALIAVFAAGRMIYDVFSA